MSWKLIVVAAVALVGCGQPDAGLEEGTQDGSVASAPSESLSSTSTTVPIESSSPVPATTLEAPDVAVVTSAPGPEEVGWLAPSSPLTGLRLVNERRDLAAGCGPDSDCELTVPSSSLEFDTDDLAAARSLKIDQLLITDNSFIYETAGVDEERTAGERTVFVDESLSPGASFIVVQWTEANEIAVTLQAFNVSWIDIELFIANLVTASGPDWPGIEVSEPLGRCVGPHTQYAPAGVPNGWVRFVLEAAPIGTCDIAPYLFMSLGIPGTVDEPGTLVTFVSSPATGGGIATGVPVDIDGVTGFLEESVGADGRAISRITMQVGDVMIGAHGNTDPETLTSLMQTIRPLDDDEWAQLVTEIETP